MRLSPTQIAEIRDDWQTVLQMSEENVLVSRVSSSRPQNSYEKFKELEQ